MKIRNILYPLVCTLIGAQNSMAEMRTWTDSDGTKLDAEFVEHINGKVTLAKDGKTGQVSISTLSSDDQKYVLNQTPPRIDIELSDSTKTDNIGGGARFQLERTIYEFSIIFKKERAAPYDRKMTAEVYLIGYNPIQDNYLVLRKAIIPLSFADAGNDKIEFPLGKLVTTEVEGNIHAGEEYEGYLVVLVDENGRVFQTEGSRSKFEEHARVIRQQNENAAVSGREFRPLAKRWN